ncbi:MAG: hypothetical protein HGA54_08545 [Actinobacteria bacterium]|nr:hypothetical protein [Actinomycetota bacterium]
MSAAKGTPNQPIINFISSVDGSHGALAEINESGQTETMEIESLRVVENGLAAMRNLYEITKDIVSQLVIEDVINAILRAATQGLGAYAADLLLRDYATGQWKVFAEYNKPFDYTGTNLSLDEYGPEISGVLEGKTVIMNNFGSWLKDKADTFDTLPTEMEKKFWLSSICLSAPLWRDGKVFGLVSVTDVDTSRQFTQNDADFLSLFTGVASVAFANADTHSRLLRLNEDLENRVEERTLQLQRVNEELERKTAQLDNALDATIRLQEQERERIANELHDTSCQMVAGALFELQAAQVSLNSGNLKTTKQKLVTAMQVIRDLDNANRTVMEAAYPSLLSNKGLVSALKYSIKGLNNQFDGSCRLVVEGTPVRLSKQIELALFRIAQEGVTNALKHARANEVSLTLSFAENMVRVRVKDDGIGFDHVSKMTGAVPHRGLVGIQDRAASIGALLTVHSASGVGTVILIELPIDTTVFVDR